MYVLFSLTHWPFTEISLFRNLHGNKGKDKNA